MTNQPTTTTLRLTYGREASRRNLAARVASAQPSWSDDGRRVISVQGMGTCLETPDYGFRHWSAPR